MNGSDFDILYYKCQKISFKRGSSYIGSYIGSKTNSNRKKKSINDSKWKKEGWNYIAIKKLLALLRGITSKHYGDFYCLNCFHSYQNLISK